jgi:hypothetical protein
VNDYCAMIAAQPMRRCGVTVAELKIEGGSMLASD